MMHFIEYADSDLLALHLAETLAEELTDALDHQDRVLFVVPGGSTPGPVFDNLCAADLDWARVDVVLSDERWVPLDHPRSNTALVQKRLLTSRASAARLLPLYSADQPLDAALPDLGAVIETELPVCVCLLGMGADMHTASLFPGAEGLEVGLASDAPVLVPIAAGNIPEPRISLSARVLAGSLSRHIVITGAEKRAAFERAQGLPPEEAPVAAVLRGADVHWAP